MTPDTLLRLLAPCGPLTLDALTEYALLAALRLAEARVREKNGSCR
jgi:hypothetical protein